MKRREAKSGGVTLIELLVAVTILAVIMLSFAIIITQMRRVVSAGQANIESNSAATAIIHTIRSDLRRVTQHGLLCITQDSQDGPGYLIFVTAGPTPSKTVSDIGTGGVVALGLCDNAATSLLEVLYYQRWVLANALGDDVWNADLSQVQAHDRGWMNDFFVNSVLSNYPGGGSVSPVSIPAGTIDEVNGLWQVLADNCQSLSIMWTDGSSFGGGLQWYGVMYEDGICQIVEQNANWPFDQFDPDDTSQIEFNALFGGGNAYRALWTHHNQNNWPVAIKIGFSLKWPDPYDPEKPKISKKYEVICPIGG